jgi:SWI/SNF-related matrix-associated actin-dependent regulator 1 of chromatin subfamily A
MPVHLPIPPGKTLKRGQPKSIQAVLRILEHGAAVGEGTARGALLADEMGTAKSPVTIVVANVLKPVRILVICPANVRETWRRHIHEWQTIHRLVVPVKARNEYDLSALTYSWVIINYDIIDRHPEIRARNWDLIIVDESQALKNYAAKRTVQVLGGKYKAKRVDPIPATKTILVTGTPFMNRPEELFTQIHDLDPASWPTFKQFIQDYYEPDYDADETRRVRGTPRNLDQLQKKLRETIMVRQLKDDVLDLLPKEYQEIEVDYRAFSPQSSLWFQYMSRKMLIVATKLRKAKSVPHRKCHRERLNKLIENVRHEVGIIKYATVLNYLKQRDDKTVVFAYHQDIIKGIAEDLRKEGRSVVTLTGKTRNGAVEIDRFQKGPDCLFFIGNFKAAGVGITLTAAAHVVFAELDWTPAMHRQAEDRAHRIGQTKQVKVVHFILNDPNATDLWIWDVLKNKEQTSQRALNTALVDALINRAS